MTNIVEWKDEERPPVGSVCEVKNYSLHDPEWEECQILFMGEFNAVYKSTSCVERVCDLGNAEFRKIKTDREKTIEAAADLLNPTFTHLNNKFVAELLFDAGMLKLPD